jgi:glutamate/tyrosine decarboxylase-like PLP-dependent enzyme
LSDTAARAARYVTDIRDRSVVPNAQALAQLKGLGGSLPLAPTAPEEVIALLDENGSRATMASTGGRYFGFVTGGTLPAALAANWLAGAWDQNAAVQVMSPVAARLEEIVLGWMLELLGLPAASGGGFVTGTTAANFSALAAARSALLTRQGWDVEERGLFGAPTIRVVVSDEVHLSVLKALQMLGLGRARVERVATDEQGRLRATQLPTLDANTIVCIQAGNVNTGSFDPAEEICERARSAGAWVHVDGAFGLWAAISPKYAQLLHGVGAADSWAIDCHKWLNVPYDSGAAFVRDAAHLRRAMTTVAAYIPASQQRDPWLYTPEASRRARGIELWAAIKSMGRSGLCEIVERNCRQATAIAAGLRSARFEILNDVVLNQVLVSFGTTEQTERVISGVQADGTCWCGATRWHGNAAMRISVSSWATTDEDIERSVAAITRVARAQR